MVPAMRWSLSTDTPRNWQLGCAPMVAATDAEVTLPLDELMEQDWAGVSEETNNSSGQDFARTRTLQ